MALFADSFRFVSLELTAKLHYFEVFDFPVYFLLLALFFYFFLKEENVSSEKIGIKSTVVVLGLFCVPRLLVVMLHEGIDESAFHPGTQAEIDRAGTPWSPNVYLEFFGAVFIAPVVEEIIYRRGLIGYGRRHVGVALATMVSVTLFAIGHLSFGFDFKSWDILYHLSSYIIVGIILTFIYLNYGLVHAIFFHVLTNFSIFVSRYPEYTSYRKVFFALSMIFAIALVVMLFKKIFRHLKMAGAQL